MPFAKKTLHNIITVPARFLLEELYSQCLEGEYEPKKKRKGKIDGDSKKRGPKKSIAECDENIIEEDEKDDDIVDDDEKADNGGN